MKSVFTENTRDVGRYLVRATHAQQLERWIGRETVELVSERMRAWPGPPIPMAGVPGRVYACGGGDFCGPIKGGYFGNLADYAVGRYQSVLRRALRRSHGRLDAGFTSLSDLISEATAGGKKQVLPYQKVGVAQPAVSSSASLWRVGTLPSAAAIAGAPAGGTVYTNATAGSLAQTDAAAGDQLHFVTWTGLSNQAQGTALMLVDLLFGVQPNYNSTAAQAITGVPTRYQTATTAPGSFLPANVTTALAATASNVTITYVDDAGNTAEAGAAQALRVSSAADTAPFTAPQWYYTLNAGDRGVRKMTSFQLSAAVSPGAVDRQIAHPLAILPGVGVANQPFILDGINSAFNLERIYDGACLSLMEWFKSATGASTYSGQITVVSG
jgi:hypothetical protein